MIEEKIEIKATADNIFEFYTDISSWPQWDPEVEYVKLSKGLVFGSKGILKPQKGPKASIEITELTLGKSFTVSSKLPLCKMSFKHEITEQQGASIVSHSVTFTGPLSFVFKSLIGKSLRTTLPNTLSSLKKYAELKNHG